MARKRIDISFDNLLKAWKDSRVADGYARDRRREMVRQYAGPNWNEQTDEADLFLNLTSLYVQTIGHTLVPKCPRFMISTFHREHRESCDVMEKWGNRELQRMKADVTMRRIVTDALFGMGVWRVALVTAPESAVRSWGQQAGEPMLSRIDREDFAWDMFAGDFSECAWMGHRYRVPLATVRDDPRFSSERKNIAASAPQPYDEYGVERVGVLGRSFYGHVELEEMAELWEFYIPRHRAIVTFATDGGGNPCLSANGRPLAEQPWIGSEEGPYGVLGYLWVPSSSAPKGPIMDLYQTDVAANMFYRKAVAQADRQKELLLFQNAEDAKRIQEANDGDTAFCERPDEVASVSYGGQAFQLIYGAAQAMRELFAFEGGNLALLGGRSAQASTARQEIMLQQNAQSLISDLQQVTLRCMNDMVRRLCWYWWKHPFAVYEDLVKVEGVPGVEHLRRSTPRGRPGISRNLDFEKLDIRIDSFSLVPQTPESRLMALRQAWREDIMPALGIMAQSGVMVDFHAYFECLGQYLDDPVFQRILTVRDPIEEEAGAASVSPGGEKTYRRISESEATDEGQGINQITTLLSGKETGGAQQSKSILSSVK